MLAVGLCRSIDLSISGFVVGLCIGNVAQFVYKSRIECGHFVNVGLTFAQQQSTFRYVDGLVYNFVC